MHCKMLLVDEYLSTIGSANMDIRSFSLNFESNALIFDDDVNQKLYNQFLEDVKNSEELTLEKYESRNKLVKIKESFLDYFLLYFKNNIFYDIIFYAKTWLII